MRFLPLLLAFLAVVDYSAAQGNHFPGRPTLTAKALQDDIRGQKLRTHANKLQQFALLGNGTRAHGTAGYNASVTYIKQLLDATGFYQTELQSITSESITFTQLAVSDSAGTTYNQADIIPMYYSPAGLVTADLLVTNNAGCESTDFPAISAGKLVVVRRGACSFTQKIASAKIAGALGVIIVNNDPDASQLPAGGLDSSFDLVPAIGLQMTAGEALITKIASTPGLTGTINVQFIAATTVGNNLIATTRQGDRRNIVHVGAHLDSVAEGPGINDNGSGSIGILELALNLRQYSIPNAVRFSWWAAEEDGDVGSTEYVAGLSDEELAKIALYLNFDMIGSTNAGHLVFDPDCSFAEVPEECPSPGVVHIRNTFQRYYNRTARIPTGTSDWGGASDYQPFLDAGIPAGYLSTGADEIITAEQALWWGRTAGTAFDPCYHQPCDSITSLNVDALVIVTKGAAYALATYANSVEGLPGRVQNGPTHSWRKRPLYRYRGPLKHRRRRHRHRN